MFVLLTALAVAGGDCFAATRPFAGGTDAILAAPLLLGQAQVKHLPPGKDALGDPLPPGAIARLGTARLRSVAFMFALSADGKTILTAAPGILGRVDAETGRMIDETEVPIDSKYSTWFSADGKLLAFNRAGAKGLLEVWDVATRKRLQGLPVLAHRVTFAPDGKTLAAAEYDGEGREGELRAYRIRIWDIATGKNRPFANLLSYPNQIVFSPNGKRLFAAVNGSMRCWDVATGGELWQSIHSPSLMAIAADGKMLCTHRNEEGLLHLWEAETGNHRGQLGDGKEWVGQLVFAPDGKSLAQVGWDILVWDLATQKVRRRFEGMGASMAFSPDSRSLFTLGTLLLRWDVASGKLRYDDTSSLGHVGPVNSLTFAPDGKSLATVGEDETLRLWNLADTTHRTVRTSLPSTRWTPKRGSNMRSSGCIESYAKPGPVFFTPDGQQLVMDVAAAIFGNRSTCAVGLVDVKSGKEIRRFELPPPADNTGFMSSTIAAAQITPDGRHLLAMGLFQRAPLGSGRVLADPQPIRAWELATGKEVLARAHTTELECAQFSPDCRLLILPWNSQSLYHVKTGREQPRAWVAQCMPVAFSADSRLAAITERDRWDGPATAIQIYDVHTHQQLAHFAPPLGWHPVRTLSADGRFLAVAGSDALYVWETSTGKRLIHLLAKGRSVPLTLDGFASCMAFSPDGKSLATGHADGTIMLWDMKPAWQNLTAPAGPVDVAACWEGLADPNPRKAYAAIDALASVPGKALPLLKRELAAVKVDGKWLAARLADLGSDKFAVREQAYTELEKVAEAAESDLRKLLEKSASQEVRNRVLGILKTLEAASMTLPASAVRELRALTVLERIGTKEAHALLRDLAAGAPDARLTQDAAAALGRLEMSLGD